MNLQILFPQPGYSNKSIIIPLVKDMKKNKLTHTPNVTNEPQTPNKSITLSWICDNIHYKSFSLLHIQKYSIELLLQWPNLSID